MDSIAVKCINDLKAKVALVPSIGEKRVHHIYSDEDITSITSGLDFPCVGVIYDGIRSVPESGSTGKQGLSAEVVCSIMLFFKAAPSISSIDSAQESLVLIDTIRGEIKGTRSPSGHFWKFNMEASIGGKKGLLAYVQRWSSPISNL